MRQRERSAGVPAARRRTQGAAHDAGRRRSVLLALSLPILATCGGEPTAPATPPPPPPPAVRYVDITGPDVGYLGYPLALRVRVLSAAYDSLDRVVTWQSSDTSVATVDATGRVTSKRTGFITISATAEAVTAGHALRIALMPVARVAVTPRADSLYPGDSLRFQVALLDSAGGTIPDHRPIAWASSDTLKATVDSAGLVHARMVGGVAVTATTAGVTGGAFVAIQLPVVSVVMPDSLTMHRYDPPVLLLPALRNAAGGQVGGRVAWRVGDATVASVNSEGVLRPGAPGVTAIVATADGLADSMLLTVVPEPPVRVVINVLTGPLQPADSVVTVFSATTPNAFGTDIPSVPVTWQVVDTTVVRARPEPPPGRSVRFTVLRPGTTAVIAEAGTLADTAVLTAYFPPVRLVAVPESLSLPAGVTGVVRPRFFDVLGGEVSRALVPGVVVRSLDTMVVMERPNGLVGRFPGRTAIVVSAGALADTIPAVVPQGTGPLLAWEWTWDGFGAWSRTTRVLQVQGLTAATALRVASADTMVAIAVPDVIANPRAAETLTVYTRGTGSTALVASGGGAFATLLVEVPGTSMTPQATIAPRLAALDLGDSAHLAVTTSPYSLVPYPVRWESSAPATVVVDGAGTVRALATGMATVRAIGIESRDSLLLVVSAPGGPVLAAVTPVPMVAGGTALLRGAGFDPSPSGDHVTVNGVEAVVTGASDTTLTVQLPAASCAPTVPVPVQLETGGRFAASTAPLAASRQRALAQGEVVEVGTAADVCDELLGDLHVLTIVNTDPDPESLRQVEVHGTAGVLPVTLPAPPPSPSTLPAGRGPAPTWRPSLDSLRAAAALHRRILEADRAQALRAGDPVPLLRAARAARPQRAVTVTINGIARIRIPRVDRPDFCATYTAIEARLVHVGTHVKVFEDVAAPLAGAMDSSYRAVADEFDAVTWPMLTSYFGDPTALDPLLDADGRIAMVFSPLVNAYGAAGFVVSCDFYPETVAPSSNTGEVIYGMVPTVPGVGYAYFTADAWRWQIRSVLAHEGKHVAAVAERLRLGLPLEEAWLEEGSAGLAEEIWARTFSHVTWKGDATYQETLWCEVRPGYPTCPDRPYSMFNTFAFLYDYLREPEHHSPLGPTAPDDATLYGSAWSLLRWTVDQYAATESGFTRALTTSPTTGLANLASRAGRPAGDLIAGWTAALWNDPASQPSGSVYEILSWNHPAIFQGMGADFPSFAAPVPTAPTVWTYGGDITVPVAVPGGSAARLLLRTGGDTRNLVRLTGPGGTAPPSSVRLQIQRFTW